VLTTLDQQRDRRLGGIVESTVVSQTPAGRVTRVDNDVLGDAKGEGQLDRLALYSGQHQRRTTVRHRMDVEQVVEAFVERPQGPGAFQFARLARPVQHVDGPDPIEVLVDKSRPEGILGIPLRERAGVPEAERKLSSRRPDRPVQKEVERNRTANLVAMSEGLYSEMRTGSPAVECPQKWDPGVSTGPS
jgi:hypothetical protein